MTTPDSQAWRIPWPDRFGEWWQRRFPALGPWLADLETRVVATERDLPPPDRPVFIAGLARSGSTMLLEWLNAMPGFTAHRYSDFPMLWTPYWWNRLLAKLPAAPVEPVERAHRDRIQVTRDSPEAFEEPIWSHFFPHDPAAESDIVDSQSANPRFERLFSAHLAKLVCARGAKRYVGKGNYDILRMGYLGRIFPGARFIVPIRRPLAQVASLLKQDRLYADAPVRTLRHIAARGHHEFGPMQRLIRIDADQTAAAEAARRAGRLADAWLLQWLAVYGHVERVRATIAPVTRVCVVDYETLCAEPEATLLHLLDAIEIDATDRPSAEAAIRIQWAARFVAADGAPLAGSAVDSELLNCAIALFDRLVQRLNTDPSY